MSFCEFFASHLFLALFGEATEWSACSRSCGSGRRLRVISTAKDDELQEEECNTDECRRKLNLFSPYKFVILAEFTEWFECTGHCKSDAGRRYRLKIDENQTEVESCNLDKDCRKCR